MSMYGNSNWRNGGGGAAYPSSSAVDNGPRAKCDQVVFEAVAKASEIIVGSRCWVVDKNSNNHHSAGIAAGMGAITGASTSGGTTRFNIQIPEIVSVRNILKRWRLALHLPLRIDVYYQHDDKGERRELLERWCLEYVFCGHHHQANFNNNGRAGSQQQQQHDPIVQLRSVCKQIVIWLRSMYCQSRLLPAQAFRRSDKRKHERNHIGFSIYTVSDGSDDLTDLVQNQGFVALRGQSNQQSSSPPHQSTPAASVVTTPYGKLVWKLVYAPASAMQHLLGSPSKAQIQILPQTTQQQQQQQQLNGVNNASSSARPIPIPGRQQHQHHQNGHHQKHQQLVPHAEESAKAYEHVAQSAPAHLAVLNGQQVPRQQQQTPPSPIHRQHTYDPSRFHMRPNGSGQGLSKTTHPHVLQRRHTSSFGEEANRKAADAVVSMDSQHPPERVLSGLSLALAEDKIHNSHQNWTKAHEAGEPERAAVDDNCQTDPSVTEKRRAALHEVPPHLVSASPKTGARNMMVPPTFSQGDYGYAYNSHIPWQKIQPSTTTPTAGRVSSDYLVAANAAALNQFHRASSASPSNMSATGLATTPPTGAFLAPTGLTGGTTPPHYALPPTSAVTPPFPPRPVGFIHTPPDELQALPKAAVAANSSPQHAAGDEGDLNRRQNRDDKLAPLTSLDLLHSSPFQQPYGSLVSSLSMGGVGPAGFTSVFTQHSSNAGGTDSLRPSIWATASVAVPGSSYDDHGYDDQEEMPFAVDGIAPPLATTKPPVSVAGSCQTTADTSPFAKGSYLGDSAAVASFAQKCSLTANHRLKLFESTATVQDSKAATSEDLVSKLADQLQEFHAFGESLHLGSPIATNGGASANVNADQQQQSQHHPEVAGTPISLQT